MKKQSVSQQGFTGIEAVGIVIILVTIGVVGWKVYGVRRANNDKPTEAQQSAQVQVAGQYENKKLGLKFAYPKEWGNATEKKVETLTPEAQKYGARQVLIELKFSNLSEIHSLTVMDKSSTSILEAVGAPVYCAFNPATEKWEPAEGSLGEPQCPKSSRTFKNQTVYQFDAVNDGAYSFIEAFSYQKHFLIFSASASYDKDFSHDQTEIGLKDGVIDRIKSFVTSRTDLLITSNF